MRASDRNKYVFSTEIFDREITPFLNRHVVEHYYFTYIARSKDGRVYKVGFSRNPTKRAKSFSHAYRQFGLEVTHFLEGNLEYGLLCSISRAGAKAALPEYTRSRRREAFYLKDKDAEHIINVCKFKPISEFDEVKFAELHNKETKVFVERCLTLEREHE